jgi:hypothetical protein
VVAVSFFWHPTNTVRMTIPARARILFIGQTPRECGVPSPRL